MFRDDTQRNLVTKTLLGALEVAHWWTERGATTQGSVAVSNFNDCNRGPFSKSGNDMFTIALSVLNPARTFNPMEVLQTFDVENRRLVGSLFAACAERDSTTAIDNWLRDNAHYQLKDARKY